MAADSRRDVQWLASWPAHVNQAAPTFVANAQRIPISRSLDARVLTINVNEQHGNAASTVVSGCCAEGAVNPSRRDGQAHGTSDTRRPSIPSVGVTTGPRWDATGLDETDICPIEGRVPKRTCGATPPYPPRQTDCGRQSPTAAANRSLVGDPHASDPALL